MKPYYQDEYCSLFLGDCLAVLPQLRAQGVSVDAVITDPPYGIGFRYDEHVDEKESYPAFLWPRIEIAESMANPGSPIFIWQSQKWMPRFHQLFPREWRVFVAAKNFVQMNASVMQNAYDPVVTWWTDGKQQEWGKPIGLVNRDWFVANSALQVLKTDSLERQHPCPRQKDHCTFIIAMWCRPSGLVLDPFCGSGTTGVACLQTGRKFIGIEISEAYCEIAARRLEKTHYQPSLSLEPEAMPPVGTRQIELGI